MAKPTAHARCWNEAVGKYEHTCQVPSGRTCRSCDEPAGTLWTSQWCPSCDVERLNRISRALEEMLDRV